MWAETGPNGSEALRASVRRSDRVSCLGWRETNLNMVFGSGFAGMVGPGGKEDTKRVRFEGHSSWRLACPPGCVRPIHDGRAPREGLRVQISVPKPGADPCVQTGGSVFRSREEQGRYPEWLPALEISMHL